MLLMPDVAKRATYKLALLISVSDDQAPGPGEDHSLLACIQIMIIDSFTEITLQRVCTPGNVIVGLCRGLLVQSFASLFQLQPRSQR